MMLAENTTTKAIEDPLNPLTINSIVVDGSFSFNTVGKEDVAKVMGKTLNMTERFINDMLPKLTCL